MMNETEKMQWVRSIQRWAGVVVVTEIISALTIFTPLPNSIAAVAAGIIVFYLAWKKPTVAMGVMVLELLIGSKGYLLQLGTWPDTVSIRILLTAAFFCGWLANVWQHRAWRGLPQLFHDRQGYLILFIVIGYATLRGTVLGNVYVTQDGNAWGDWFLLFPVLDLCWRYRECLRRDLAPVLLVGIAWLAVKTIGLEYLFSHGFKSISPNAYLWVRRTGVGEVTLVVANAFRLFMQSYIYAIPAMIASVAYMFVIPTEASRRAEESLRRGPSAPSDFARDDGKKIAWVIVAATTLILGISLSRSFWIGTFIGIVSLIAILTKKKIAWWKQLVGPISAGIVGVAAIAAILAFPIPRVDVAGLGDLFGSRTSLNEAAAVSRWNLLPVLWHKIEEHPILGSGFGATVTYKTSDPRILKDHPDGMYSTYAFEWGWMEHWIKFGIIGIPLLAYLLWSLGRRFWKLEEPLWLKTAVVSSLVALAGVHFFTPYLNHPLGFLFFFVGEGMILSSQQKRHEAP